MGDVTASMNDIIAAAKKNRKWFFGVGIAMVILGTLAIILPHAATIATEILIGWLLLFAGAAQLMDTIMSRGCGGFWLKVLGTILYLAAGVFLLVNPPEGVITLTAVLIALFIAGGIFRIISAMQLKDISGWGWILFSGIVTLALGFVLWAGWPGDAAWAIGLIVGIDLVFAGWWMVMFATGLKG